MFDFLTVLEMDEAFFCDVYSVLACIEKAGNEESLLSVRLEILFWKSFSCFD